MSDSHNAGYVLMVDPLDRLPEPWAAEAFHDWTQAMGLSINFKPEDIQLFLAYTHQLNGASEKNPFERSLDFPIHPRMILI